MQRILTILIALIFMLSMSGCKDSSQPEALSSDSDASTSPDGDIPGQDDAPAETQEPASVVDFFASEDPDGQDTAYIDFGDEPNGTPTLSGDPSASAVRLYSLTIPKGDSFTLQQLLLDSGIMPEDILYADMMLHPEGNLVQVSDLDFLTQIWEETAKLELMSNANGNPSTGGTLEMNLYIANGEKVQIFFGDVTFINTKHQFVVSEDNSSSNFVELYYDMDN